MNLNLSDKPKKDNRMLAVGLAVAAAALLIFAAFSKTWVSRPAPFDIGFGPLGCDNCGQLVGAEGSSMSNSAFVDKLREISKEYSGGGSNAEKMTSGAFAPMGLVTFGLSLLAALGLLGGASLAFTKKRPELPISPASVALLGVMAGLITACVFVATKPGGPGFVGVSMGFWAFAAGAVMGIASAQMIAKLIRPVDPDLLADAMNPEAY